MADAQDILNQLSQMTATYASQLQRLAAGMSGTTATITGAANQLKPTLAQVGAGMMKLRGEIDRGRVGYDTAGKALRSLEQQFEELDDTLKQSKQGEAIRNEQMRMSSQLVGQAFGELAADLGKIAISTYFEYFKNQVITGTKALQENSGAVSMSYELQKRAITDVNAGLSETQKSLTLATAGLVGFAPQVAVFTGAAASIVGIIRAIKEVQANGLDILQTELQKTTASFKSVTGAGALYANGMTEMRDVAAVAVLDIKSFAEITAANAEKLSRLGGSVADGSKRFAMLNREMLPFREKLFNLGYSFEDQAQLTIDYMDMLQKTNQLEGKSAADLAKQTDAYLTNLKAITAYTGEDARTAAQRSKEAMSPLAVRAELEKLGQGATEKFDSAIKYMPPVLTKAIQQGLVNQGAITDPSINVALQAVPAMREMYNRTLADMKDKSLTQAQFNARYEANMKELAPMIKQQSLTNGAILSRIEIAGGTGFEGINRGLESIYDAALRGKETAEKDEDRASSSAEKLKNTTDTLTTAVSSAQTAFANAATYLNTELTGVLKDFVNNKLAGYGGLTDTIVKATDKIRTAIDAVKGGEAKPLSENAGNFAARYADTEAGLPMESKATGSPYNLGTPSAVPDWYTDWAKSRGLGRAKGGISSGPLSGFMELLHGTEAVVPLPDGKTIPVNVNYNTAGLTDNLLSNQTKQLNESFATAMALMNAQLNEKNRDLVTSVSTDPEKLSTSVANAVISAFNSPSELTRVMEMVKEQIANGSKEQLEALQTQLDKMDQLVTAMQNNVYASERIANELA